MTPTVRQVLMGSIVALQTPPSPDAGPDYNASRTGMVSMLTGLAIAEAEHVAAATVAENADIRELFAQDARTYDAALGGRLWPASRETDEDLSQPALDAANAALRRLLIELHERVEEAGDIETERAICRLYVRMAAGRKMEMGR